MKISKMCRMCVSRAVVPQKKCCIFAYFNLSSFIDILGCIRKQNERNNFLHSRSDNMYNTIFERHAASHPLYELARDGTLDCSTHSTHAEGLRGCIRCGMD